MNALGAQAPIADDLEKVARVLKRAAGITFGQGLIGTLQTAFAAASADLGIDSSAMLRRLLAGESEAVKALIERAVISETYFFRHPEHFDSLTGRVLPLLGNPSSLRIWSAGCATGEEPYSIAMTLLGQGRMGDRIVGTDISRSALQRAEAAQYGSWSFRRVDPNLRDRFFEARGASWQLSADVRRMTGWAQHNLVNDPPPGADFQVVFCRNVLIYLEGEHLQRALSCLQSALLPGGFLILSVPELPLIDASLPFERLEDRGVVLFRKHDRLRPSAARKPAPAKRAQPAPRLTGPAAKPATKRSEGDSRFERARTAARAGDLLLAEQLAEEVARTELLPEAFLLLARTAEERGDLPAAIAAVRRALYLEANLAMGHAMLVSLFSKQGALEEAARSRRNALRLLEGIPDDTVLRAVEPITAGSLRIALGERN